MSGYRSLHREQVSESGKNGIPLWSVQLFQSSASSTHIVSGSGDGYVRIHSIREKEIGTSGDVAADAVLDASALSLTLTHVLLGNNKNKVYPPASEDQEQTNGAGLMGITQVSCIRNYVGDDTMAGDFVICSLDLSGRVRVWTLYADELVLAASSKAKDDNFPKQIKACHEFVVRDATGTILALRKPHLEGPAVMMAIACLDGTVQLISSGIKTPKYTKDTTPPGDLMYGPLGSPGSSIVLSLIWHRTDSAIIVGRKDGTVEIMALLDHNNQRKSSSKHHRMTHAHAGPVRGLTLTPDSQLLVSGSDDGYIAVWDLNRNVPTLVHHVDEAHSSWILCLLSVEQHGDSRRFLSCGADGKIHVWNVGQIYAPMHTYDVAEPDRIWTLSTATATTTTSTSAAARFVSGSEQGYLQVYSIETK